MYFELGKGRICQIASIAAYTPGPLAAVYHGTKSFARDWAIALNRELYGTGVGVTIVSPGAIDTNFISTSSSNNSIIFTWLKRVLVYSPQKVAKDAMVATLAGKEEIITGFLFVFVGPTFTLLLLF